MCEPTVPQKHILECPDIWQMKTLNRAAVTLELRHTTANITTWIEGLIEKLTYLPPDLKAVVHDNWSNMAVAMWMLDEKPCWASVHCTGHIFQLTVNNALKGPSISRAVGAMWSLSENLRISMLAADEHKADAGCQFISRRNSTYYMVEGLLEHRRPVTATPSDPEVTPRGKRHFDLKLDQWVLLEEAVKGL